MIQILSSVALAILIGSASVSEANHLGQPIVATKVVPIKSIQVTPQVLVKPIQKEPIVTLRDPPLTVPDFQNYTYLLPQPIREYINRGSFDETTLRQNREAFNRLRIRPRLLRDLSQPSLVTTVLGRPVSMPIGAAGLPLARIANDDGDIGIAKACEALGNTMILGAAATDTIEDVAAAAPINCNRLLEILIYPNRTLVYELVKRAEATGYRGIVVETSIPVLGIRTYNIYNNFQVPSNIRPANQPPQNDPLIPYNEDLPVDDQTASWEDIKWLTRHTRLPIIVKGILTAEDALQAAEAGASGVIVSNNNGRQLNRAPANIEALPEVVNAVGNRLEVHIEGDGVDGTQVLIALGLGARSVFLFRPIFWGLAYNGGAGVQLVQEVLARELRRAMILAGTPRADQIDRNLVVPESYYYGGASGRVS